MALTRGWPNEGLPRRVRLVLDRRFQYRESTAVSARSGGERQVAQLPVQIMGPGIKRQGPAKGHADGAPLARIIDSKRQQDGVGLVIWRLNIILKSGRVFALARRSCRI